MLLERLDALAREAPERIAVQAADRPPVTRAEFAAMAREAGHAIRSCWGGKAEDGPVVVVVDGSPRSLASLVGALGCGLGIVAVEAGSPALTGSRGVLADLEVGVVVAADVPALWPNARVLDPGDLGGAVSLTTFPEMFPAAPSCDPELLQLTSGSSGQPRLARQTYAGAVVAALSYVDRFQLAADDVVVLPVSAAHSYGMAGMLSALLVGATVTSLPTFTPAAAAAALRDATVLFGTPLMYRYLTVGPLGRDRAGALRLAVSAGAPLDAQVAEAFRTRTGVAVRQVYGSTEAGLIACTPAWRSGVPPDAVGPVAPGVDVRVAPDGELLVRTRSLMRGYFGDGPLHLDRGFYPTGDLGAVGEDGLLRITGRKSRFAKIGGRRVGFALVEDALKRCPGVVDAVARSRPGPNGEEELVGYVVLAGTAPAEVLTALRDGGLAPYEVPSELRVIAELPRNHLGKVVAEELEEMVEKSSTSRV
ncbi:class I adenylate-forming enzyme family protein [Myceligenerans xiligouense]|uniref:Fatty acid CoA ligase FadD36 n=1 Tax=Myceligenerans xiligouense TaxID=253184 RepID=A0A3N4YIQ4_9MICO|nr:fatty acid--CoA ligase family protein [Myceligenerans xiligouense]RPF19987.1 fatty acid CoA ligase FadD36 [Myceligenerans xiligouense]